MMSDKQQPVAEQEFIKVIGEKCSGLHINMNTSEVGWNEGERTIFLLLKFKMTLKPYPLST